MSGLGQTQAQLTAQFTEWQNSQTALAQAAASGNTTAIQAAQARVVAAQASLDQGLAVTAPGTASAAAAPSLVPYVIAGAVGVAVIGALIYFATE
jgi:hypothetical protein